LVDYAAHEKKRIGTLGVRLVVKNNLLVNVFSCSTKMTGSEFYDLAPQGQISCRVDPLPLIPGRYWIDIQLTDAEGVSDHVESAASFDVIDTGNSGLITYADHEWGSVIVPHTWRITSS
jgi:hypothetical protein